MAHHSLLLRLEKRANHAELGRIVTGLRIYNLEVGGSFMYFGQASLYWPRFGIDVRPPVLIIKWQIAEQNQRITPRNKFDFAMTLLYSSITHIARPYTTMIESSTVQSFTTFCFSVRNFVQSKSKRNSPRDFSLTKSVVAQ